jgi:hypothetical protein
VTLIVRSTAPRHYDPGVGQREDDHGGDDEGQDAESDDAQYLEFPHGQKVARRERWY